jgi:polyferredoxin/Pyruvate/2-oxoacid:ferredoxin oxidoreductase delta subunit
VSKKENVKTSPARKLVQLIILLIFCVLFITTTYRGGDRIHYPINVFLQLDPLGAIGNLLSSRTLNAFFLPSLLLIGATLILGRFFCGWVCPLGGTLDLLRPTLSPRRTRWEPSRNLKYYLLVAILVAALFSVNLAGLFDPISILIRSFTLALYPIFSKALTAVFDQLYFWNIPGVTPISERISTFLRSSVLPFQQGYFYLSLVSGAIFLSIVFLEKIRPRFWCRYLCPLGALLGICASVSLLKRKPAGLCKGCTECSDVCEMNAFGKDGKFQKGECILTMSCVRSCREQKVSYRLGLKAPRTAPSLKRRYVISSLLAGVLAAPLLAISPIRKLKETKGLPRFIRPAGAVPEDDFLHQCVKCSECMMVCPTGGLQPDLGKGGLEGIFSPVLVPRVGYCEFNCTLCGQVCPTHAIKELTIPEKNNTIIGKAYIDPGRCFPHAFGINCAVCEEHCPVVGNAIQFKETGELSADGTPLKKPYVVYDRCVGCGICEFKCPIGGEAAIIVTSVEQDS